MAQHSFSIQQICPSQSQQAFLWIKVGMPIHLGNNASYDFSKGSIGSFAFSVTYGSGWRCGDGGGGAFRRRKFWWRMEPPACLPAPAPAAADNLNLTSSASSSNHTSFHPQLEVKKVHALQQRSKFGRFASFYLLVRFGTIPGLWWQCVTFIVGPCFELFNTLWSEWKQFEMNVGFKSWKSTAHWAVKMSACFWIG